MRWLSLILIAFGVGHLILKPMGYGMKILRIFGDYDTIAAVTLLITGLLIYLITLMKPDTPTYDTPDTPDTDAMPDDDRNR